MNADRHGLTRSSGQMLAVLLWLTALSACDIRPSAPETRASYFIEKLIVEPQNETDLRGVTGLPENQSPETLVKDLQTRTAVGYLRARHRLGAELGFHIAGTIRRANGDMVVEVTVSEGVPTVGKPATVRFQVELHNQNRQWIVVHLQSD